MCSQSGVTAMTVTESSVHKNTVSPRTCRNEIARGTLRSSHNFPSGSKAGGCLLGGAVLLAQETNVVGLSPVTFRRCHKPPSSPHSPCYLTPHGAAGLAASELNPPHALAPLATEDWPTQPLPPGLVKVRPHVPREPTAPDGCACGPLLVGVERSLSQH